MSDKPFLIYRSSAGTGKTFALAREYLKLALRHSEGFRSILGVTFTNKATEEMKSRIINVLKVISNGEPHPMKSDLMEALNMSETVLQQRSKEVLTTILHQYGRFAVVTIDSFFHQVIRSFARELGIQGSFSITLETQKVMQEVVDNLLSELGEEDKKEIRRWLTQFAENNVEEGKQWDFRRDIGSLADEILKDNFKLLGSKVFLLDGEPDFFSKFINELDAKKSEFLDQTGKWSSEALELIEEHGGVEAFKGKGSGPAGLFRKIANREFEISSTRRKAADDLSSWLTKQTISNPALASLVENEILPVYKKLIDFIDSNYIDYKSATEVQRYFYTYGVLSAINQKLLQYRNEHDVLLIADLPDFLRQIINDSETPYIYEKVGSVYQHYLIDEFQDTSLFQWNNFRSLVKNATDANQKSMVVGDIKQSIYRWRGGDWGLLQNSVKNDIGDFLVDEKDLSRNWRSKRLVVDFNNNFFKGISEIAGTYFSDLDPKYDGYVNHVLEAYENVEQEITSNDNLGHVEIEFIPSDETNWKQNAIRKTINKVESLQQAGYRLHDIAILTRTQREGKEISDAFFAYKNTEEADPGLKYDVVSSESLFLYSSHAVKFIIGLIKWLHNEEDDIVKSEWLYEYQRFILKQDQRTDDTIFQSRESWHKRVPGAFVRQKNYFKSLPLYELVESIIDLFDLDKMNDEYTYLQGFQDAVLDYTKSERGDITSFLSWWEDIRKQRAIQISDENDAVKVLTIHKAKGLEYSVVIVPFLSWKLDHDTYSKEEILWCTPPEIAPYDQLPVIPLKYSSSLRETYWASQYWQEKINAFLDNLNLLYVAFTRPVDALFAFGELPRNERISTVGQLTYHRVKGSGSWDEEKNLLKVGELRPGSDSNESSNEYGLKVYNTRPWRDKVSVQMKGSQDLSERVFSAQKWGIEFHQSLGKLKRLEDLPRIKDDTLKRELKMIVHHEDIEPFFKDVDEVRVEEPILLPGGDYKRIDRLVRKKDQWLVIDYKTGKRKQRDHQQVIEYMSILEEMGYKNVKGYLVYLEPLLVESVA